MLYAPASSRDRFSPIVRKSHDRNGVCQAANGLDLDVDDVTLGKREVHRRDYPGSGHHCRPVRHRVVPLKPIGDVFTIPLHLAGGSRPVEHFIAVALDRKPDSQILWVSDRVQRGEARAD